MSYLAWREESALHDCTCSLHLLIQGALGIGDIPETDAPTYIIGDEPNEIALRSSVKV
jgi:hypothetical protein